MKTFLTALTSLLLLLSSAAIAAEITITDKTLEFVGDPTPQPLPSILVVSLWNQSGVPDGWIDSTTRPDATDICNALIATQSKLYATPVSKSRCIIKVQSDRYDNP